MLLAPGINGQKIVRFVVMVAREAAQALVPDSITLPAKVCALFYKCFCVVDLTSRNEILDQLAKGNEDKLTDEIIAAWREVLPKGVLPPSEIRDLVHKMLLSLGAAHEAHQNGRDPSQALRQSLKLPPTEISREQRAIGRLLTASMMMRREQAGKPYAHKSMPAIPGYEVRRPLGQGAFATVYLAVHQLTGEWRAIKFGKLDDSNRLNREMAIMQAVDHRHLVRYYDHGKLKDKQGAKYYWIAMEYLGENNMADMLAATDYRLDMAQALIFTQQILHGLVALHEKQIIHRDLKPENVMVDGEFRVRLIDFGLAKPFQVEASKTMGLTVAGELIGTPGYMSPEQVRGEMDLTLATDIWSFGVIFHELLVGERLFQGVNVAMIWNDILTKSLTFDREQIPAEFRSFFTRCLNHDASQRFCDATKAHVDFCRCSVELQRRLRYERNREKWNIILKNGLLEQFAGTYQGQLPVDPIVEFRTFCGKQGIDGGFDHERLQEILAPIFASQGRVEAVRRRLEQSEKKLQRELTGLSAEELDNQTKIIAELKREIEAGPTTVRAETHRQLAAEVATWEESERLREEVAKWEETERLEKERLDKERRDTADWEEAEAKRRSQEQLMLVVRGVFGSVCMTVVGLIGAVVGAGVFYVGWMILGIPVAIILGIAGWIFKWNPGTSDHVTIVVGVVCISVGAVVGAVVAVLNAIGWMKGK